jgi:integrase
MLAEHGNDAKVVQELMRHAKLSTTMEIYTHPGWKRSGRRRAKLWMCCSGVSVWR